MAFYELRQYKVNLGKMAEYAGCLDRSGMVVQRIAPTSRSVAQ